MRKPTTTSIESDVPIHFCSVARATCATPHPSPSSEQPRTTPIPALWGESKRASHMHAHTRPCTACASARTRAASCLGASIRARAKDATSALPLRSSNAQQKLCHFLFERAVPRLVRQHGVKRPATDTRHMGGRPPTVCSISQIGGGLGLFRLGGSPLVPQRPCFWS